VARAGAYFAAVIAVAVTTALRLAADPWLAGDEIFIASFAAVAVAVWVGGVGPAIFAALFAYALDSLLFLSPRHSAAVMPDGKHAFTLVLYLVDCGVIIAIGELLRHALDAARRDRNLLELALRAANMNTFAVDINEGTASRSENAARFYGLTGPNDSRSVFLDNIHPEDKQRHLDAIKDSIATGKEFFSEYRFVRPDDQRVIWVEAHGRVVRDRFGNTKMMGAAMDVTQRVSLEERLARQAQELARASERKSQVIATVAHELRNPLAPIRGGVSLLKDSRAAQHSKDLALAIVDRQTRRLERLIEDLLDISSIEQGKIRLCFECVEIAEVIKKAAEASLPYIEERAQRLSVVLPEKPLTICGDEGRLVQVFNNLLNNSSKFTVPGGSISIQATGDSNKIRIAVQDNGIGIPADRLKQIFEAFFQVGSQGSGVEPGLGLGLALSKAIVELHGGHIEAQSAGLGEGSTFIVSLPIDGTSEEHGRTGGFSAEAA